MALRITASKALGRLGLSWRGGAKSPCTILRIIAKREGSSMGLRAVEHS